VILTPTDRNILRLIAENKVTNQIAETLFISPRNVEHHRAHICEKLHFSGVYALVRFVPQHKTSL
jgi:two-component system, NarL family, nitrate/nitrite response regulator NarL